MASKLDKQLRPLFTCNIYCVGTCVCVLICTSCATQPEQPPPCAAPQNGNILAVGMYDGTVAIYDVMTRQQTAAMESNHSSGKHSDPVWKMRWVEQVPDVDRLVTISTDGRISLWSITKGLEFSDLMKLKRVVPKQAAPTQVRGAGRSPLFCCHRGGGQFQQD